jgi:hypothetical protein
MVAPWDDEIGPAPLPRQLPQMIETAKRQRTWMKRQDPGAAAGGELIGWDDAWRAHRIHAAYTVPASCQIVTFPVDISERRRVFSDAFLARAEAAIADLEAVAALHDAGL